MKEVQQAIAVIAASMLTTLQVNAGLLAAGDLTVNIRNDNGAVDNLTFQGKEFFKLGHYVSDFGIQNGSDTATFSINDAYGSLGQPISVAGSTVLGTYTGGGGNVDFQRSYSIVPGLPVLKISTTFVNNGGSMVLSYFDTYDPDQGGSLGGSLETFNDVYNLAAGTVGQSRVNTGGNQHTVIAGTLDSRATVAAGGPFAIDTGALLNAFFAAPVDGNDALADAGLHVGLQTNLGAGESTSFTYYLAFGTNPTETQNSFVAAIPEPATMGLMGFLSLGTWFIRRRFYL